MGSKSKYLFETEFGNTASRGSRRRVFSEEDIESAKQEALVEARAELQSYEKKRAADLLTALSAKLDAVSLQRAEDLQLASQGAAEIAVAICRKVLPTLAAQNALTEIEGHILRTVADIQGEPRIVVRTSEPNIATLQARVDSLANGFDGKIVLLADDQMSVTDCHVVWADGGSERDVQRTCTEINKVVEQITNAEIISSATTPHAPEAPALDDVAGDTNNEAPDGTQETITDDKDLNELPQAIS